MSAASEETPGEDKPRTTFFRSRYKGPKLDVEAAKRQGDITSLAFVALGGRDEALAFLNEPNEALGGRPLDLAVADAAGFARVRAALDALKPGLGA